MIMTIVLMKNQPSATSAKTKTKTKTNTSLGKDEVVYNSWVVHDHVPNTQPPEACPFSSYDELNSLLLRYNNIVCGYCLNPAPLLEIIDRKDYDNLSEKHRMLLPYVVIQMSCGDSLVRGINRKKITGNEMIETSLKRFIESNMKWVSNKANIHVSKDGRKRIDDYKGKEYQNVIVANALLMLLLNALVTGNEEIVAFERFEAIMHA